MEDTPQPDHMPHIIHAIMSKRSRHRNFSFSTWKDRLFLLDADRMKLSYYTIPNVSCDWTKVDPPVGTKKGEVSLINCRVSIVPEAIAERVFMFHISTAEGDLYISAPTKQIREKWVRHIQLISEVAALQLSVRRPQIGDKYFKYRTRRLMDRVLYPEFVEPSESESFAWEADSDTSDVLAQTLVKIAHCNAVAVADCREPSDMKQRGGMQVHINHGMSSSIKPELKLSWNMYNEKRRLEDERRMYEMAMDCDEAMQRVRKEEWNAYKKDMQLERFCSMVDHEHIILADRERWGIEEADLMMMEAVIDIYRHECSRSTNYIVF